MKSFKATGHCHRRDPVEKTLVDSPLVSPCLLTFLLLVQNCLLALRRSLRQPSSTHQVQNRVEEILHGRRIFVTVQRVKDRGKKTISDP